MYIFFTWMRGDHRSILGLLRLLLLADNDTCGLTYSKEILKTRTHQWQRSATLYYIISINDNYCMLLACFVYSSLSGQAPPYLADDIHLVSEGPRRRLPSSTDRSCAVPRTHNTFGDRSFAAAGPRLWNSLQVHLRDEDISYNSFQHELKTFWF